MGAKKKYKNHYPLDNGPQKTSSSNEDKLHIEAYIKRIEEMLKDPKNQKKAAEILSQLINKK